MGKLRDYIETTSYLTIGIQFALSIFIGFGIGYWLDERFDTSPWLTIAWFLIGLAAGFKNVYMEVKKLNR